MRDFSSFAGRSAGLLFMLAASGLAACAQLPGRSTASETAAAVEPPSLMPIDTLLARVPPPQASDPAAGLSAEANRLKAEAEALKRVDTSG